MTTLRTEITQESQLAGLSQRTQETYLRAVRQLADHYDHAPDELTQQQVRDYLLSLKNGKNREAPTTLRTGGNDHRRTQMQVIIRRPGGTDDSPE